MGQTLDFDQARRQRRKPSTLRAFGREWPVPSSPPVGFTLYTSQLRDRGEDGTVTAGDMLEVLKHAVGASTFEGLISEGLEPQDVDIILDLLRAEWSKGQPEEGDEGEAPAPEEGAGSDT